MEDNTWKIPGQNKFFGGGGGGGGDYHPEPRAKVHILPKVKACYNNYFRGKTILQCLINVT